MPPLPPHFTSLYRICLRAVSAAVLHQSFATRKLRTLFKPSFREAAKVVRQVQDARAKGIDDAAVKTKEKWLEDWNRRADNTLSLLLNSATSKGLPHKVTRNLALLEAQHRSWAEKRYYSSRGYWNPSLPVDDQRYVDPSFAVSFNLLRESKRDAMMRQQEIIDAAWGPLGEVVRMAEGRDGVWLGRVGYRLRWA
ncbi:hypothetical protein OE88DRAFT_1735559 [Heliocybe sulcata]|uniref:Uncharacterized protein n=1 Tax=Heliocybe sulcata TaxID=5364 RepID=A0A5C3N017_9AGAM|nr:hypothetical protein OE88DRAFT_1735559 [Heliocybe sulcata]